MGNVSKLNRYLKANSITIIDYSQKRTRKGFIPMHDKDNFVVSVGINAHVDVQNPDVIKYSYALAVKHPADVYKSRVAKRIVVSKFKSGDIDGIVDLSLEVLKKIENKQLAVLYMIFRDICIKIEQNKFKMIKSDKSKRRLYRHLIAFLSDSDVIRAITPKEAQQEQTETKQQVIKQEEKDSTDIPAKEVEVL